MFQCIKNRLAPFLILFGDLKRIQSDEKLFKGWKNFPHRNRALIADKLSTTYPSLRLEHSTRERDAPDLSQTGQWVLADWREKYVFVCVCVFFSYSVPARWEDFGLWQAGELPRQKLHVTAVLSEVKNSHERGFFKPGISKIPVFLGKEYVLEKAMLVCWASTTGARQK